MRLATLGTNRQHCCLPLHMEVRLTPAVDSVQVSTCYCCYAIVESVWSEVVFVRCVTKMDRQKFEQRWAIKFCVKLGESATVTYEKLQRAYGENSLSRAQVFRWHKSPCSSDLSPCDFFLFPRLKNHLKGRHFGTLDNIQKSVTDELKGIPAEAFQHCYEQWKQRIRRCVAAQGNYFEVDKLDL